ncbi:hypothetical protein [Crassaminicella indica]|uniref:Uncharacterized protein n=1 Tax=Crassaminicella indica TaxID=2855394 RepID=A0ABX8RDI2_9CLOT|nr:hypothetical protein [Crassaminicella indica]QXM07144.1 hypothetical protein KVH43_05435 [Crassaminicella indica]
MEFDPQDLPYILLIFSGMLFYNLPIFMLFWLFYDDNRMLTIKKATKIQQINYRFLLFNIVLYIPYLYLYNLLTIIFDRLPPLWITIIPVICSWINIKLSNSLLDKAKENTEQ